MCKRSVELVHIKGLHFNCPSTSGDLEKYCAKPYDVTALLMHTWKKANLELRNSPGSNKSGILLLAGVLAHYSWLTQVEAKRGPVTALPSLAISRRTERSHDNLVGPWFRKLTEELMCVFVHSGRLCQVTWGQKWTNE